MEGKPIMFSLDEPFILSGEILLKLIGFFVNKPSSEGVKEQTWSQNE